VAPPPPSMHMVPQNSFLPATISIERPWEDMRDSLIKEFKFLLNF
jgi:hypothetical protein